MIKLINRGKYEKAVQDEFEHLTNRLSTFLGQIFDENGIYIPPSAEGGDVTNIVSAVRRTWYGDLAINAGSSVGFSTLPWIVDVNKTLLVNLGSPGTITAITFVPGSSTQLRGQRQGVSGDAVLYYVVMEFW